jgi:hypothetical protein
MPNRNLSLVLALRDLDEVEDMCQNCRLKFFGSLNAQSERDISRASTTLKVVQKHELTLRNGILVAKRPEAPHLRREQGHRGSKVGTVKCKRRR